jgi:hypothetical protein
MYFLYAVIAFINMGESFIRLLLKGAVTRRVTEDCSYGVGTPSVAAFSRATSPKGEA